MSTSAVEIRNKELSTNAWGLLQGMKKGIAAVLPKHMTPDRMAMIAFTAMRRNPKLMECSAQSIIGSIMTAAMLGLEPSGPLGHGYLIPYKGECQFQPGYQGLLDLARRSGLIKDVQLREVYAGDTYKFAFGLEPTIEHIPLEGEGADSPDRVCTHVYCIIRFSNGGIQWDQMSFAQAIAHAKRFSQTWDPQGKRFKAGSPWAEHPIAMALKTILKRTLKLCPKSPEMASALLHDDMSSGGRLSQMKQLEDGSFDVDFGEEPQKQEREHSVVDINSLKGGQEENRGHGNEGLDNVKKSETTGASSETKRTEPVTTGPKPETFGDLDPEMKLTQAQHDELEKLRTQNNVDTKVWLEWAKKTFDVKMVSQLRQKHFARCKVWTEAGGEEQSDAQ